MPAGVLDGYREFHNAEEAERWAEVHYPDLCGERRANNPDYERLFFYAGNVYRRYNKTLRYGGKDREEQLPRMNYEIRAAEPYCNGTYPVRTIHSYDHHII